MIWFAKVIYRALVWKERQRARRDRAPSPASRPPAKPEHLKTGERGEMLAYWHLRQAGYTIVARNWSSRTGELDLVAWDGPILAFVEVKTRTSFEAGPPEAAVSHRKQGRIAQAAREYLRRLGPKTIPYRFDIVSVSWDATSGFQARLIKDAFKA